MSALLALASSAGIAQATIIFSDVTIAGSLSSTVSYQTGTNDIDFFFDSAMVGDPVDPLRVGTISLTYIAESDLGIEQDVITLSVLGALSGSGTIFFNEVVEDLADPGVILAKENAVLDSNSQLPYVSVLEFAQPSTMFKVKKSVVLVAPDTAELDLALVSLIEQTLYSTPEPASLNSLAFGSLAILLRRRRRPRTSCRTASRLERRHGHGRPAADDYSPSGRWALAGAKPGHPLRQNNKPRTPNAARARISDAVTASRFVEAARLCRLTSAEGPPYSRTTHRRTRRDRIAERDRLGQKRHSRS
jgi:hypothetical protein